MTLFYRCANCNQINENPWICAFCDCEALIEFEIEDLAPYVEPGAVAEDLAPYVEPDPVADIEGVHRCPECRAGYFLDINCGIFRCGALKSGALNPHASKAELDELEKTSDWDSGCGCPLWYNPKTSSLEVDIDPATGEKRYR